MLVRIVKLSFEEAHVANFLENFHKNKQDIRHFEGCRFLELYRDLNDPTTFFTYSYWDNSASLDRYRHSDLFKGVWAKTKPLFKAAPKAWSVDKLVSIE
ncbi:MAG: antibiotic biosynthesis monooxygenase [Flavobacteriaceae bacterium]|nr:antibiotic biosynthesis monooxygenase [Flavobacteriaceae bacterium]